MYLLSMTEGSRRKEGGTGSWKPLGREELAVRVRDSVRENTLRPVNVCYLTLDSEVEDDVISHRRPLRLNHVTTIMQRQHGLLQISKVRR